MRVGRLASCSVVLVVATLALLVTSQPAAAEGTVGTGTPASCTEAALDAALAGGGTVTFNCGPIPVTITLTTQKEIGQTTIIDGKGLITLSGGGTTRHFFVMPDGNLSLIGLTLAHGAATNEIEGQGGAIFNHGGPTVSGCLFYSNEAPGSTAGAILNTAIANISGSMFIENDAGGGFAGAIANSGTMTISDCDFNSNRGYYLGGAVTNTGTLSISGSDFSDNRSSTYGGAIGGRGSVMIVDTTFSGNIGAIWMDEGTLDVSRTRFTGNTASGDGGAIFTGGDLTVSHSTFSGNSAGSDGGAIFATGDVAVSDSTFSGNTAAEQAGGIYSSGTLAITGTTFMANSAVAGAGGGLYSTGGSTVTVTNSTFSGNSAGTDGGGMVANGMGSVTNCTLYGNEAGGLVNGGVFAQLTMRNTILAGNEPYNCSGPITSMGHNLESRDTCGLDANGDLVNRNPLLGPLADNGGPTFTHALLTGSPAIEHGSNEGCPTTDQRGVPRPLLRICDIGAYEFELDLYVPMVLKH